MNIKQALCALMLLSATELAVADSTQQGCRAASRPEARALGDLHYQQHDFNLAAECYRAAAEYSLADRAFLKAAQPESETTARTLATNRDEVKTQVRKLQQAFRALR